MKNKSIRKNKKLHGQGRYALVVVSILFLLSGIIRLSSGSGAAIAKEIEALRAQRAPNIGSTCEPQDSFPDLLYSLKEREDRVLSKELAIENRMVTLEHAEIMYRKSLTELIAAEEALSATISRADSASEADLSQLTAMYENMKPKDAAALFEEMDPDFSSGFLGRMRPDAAASVLAGLKPETAYAISVILAGRNADVPRNGF